MEKSESVAKLTVGDIEKMLTDTLTIAAKNVHDDCPIPCSAKPHLPAVFTMLEDVDGGDLKRGIEEVRHNHEFTTELRTTLKSMGNKLIMSLAGLVVVGFVGIIVFAVKHWVKG